MEIHQCECFLILLYLQLNGQSIVVLGMLIVTNFVALSAVAFRLQKRYIRNTLWVDDFFAVATGCSLLFTLFFLSVMGLSAPSAS